MTGAIILKQAMITFYHWILHNNLFDIVLLVNLVHDEVDIEYPENLDFVSNILKEHMEKAANIFCKKLPIPVEVSVGLYWIH